MNVVRYRAAAVPVDRARRSRYPVLPDVSRLVLTERPDDPLHCLRPRVLAESAARFVELFSGDVLYAVKCNPQPAVLRALWKGGLRHFDAASLNEVRLVRGLFPAAVIHFMHPIKTRSAIRQAYFQYGVRDFVLDAAEELDKILAETDDATDLGLIVRLALPKGKAVYDLSGKFGAAPDEAAALLRKCRHLAPKIGISFHVGSQCLEPEAYERALALAGEVLAMAGVDIDVLDVGGGFPVSYPAEVPPPLDAFIEAIDRGVAKLNLPAACRLWSEPGRALAAPGESIVVRVIARKNGALYVNDGIYGALSDAGASIGFRFPVRLIGADGGERNDELRAFEFFGPTCDSADRMKGPFLLPADTREGDWIEIGQLGAYGTALRTGFNGFDQTLTVEVEDRPLLETPGYLPAAMRAA
ncbi:type III PLP-dependent enzyme [Telmatospirillum siberiense]|uniref:ornithine decarboxylase n=1 Tax=Telmatospirillum siberiense TaxID=382514 RepID=A0A2N3PUB8_9PROT|nr:type III PLP-dependent enzyme [Telmatospirillum siberiense]PKU24002.1 decarboxylase [Telmatospirillum siberiense]